MVYHIPKYRFNKINIDNYVYLVYLRNYVHLRNTSIFNVLGSASPAPVYR